MARYFPHDGKVCLPLLCTRHILLQAAMRPIVRGWQAWWLVSYSSFSLVDCDFGACCRPLTVCMTFLCIGPEANTTSAAFEGPADRRRGQEPAWRGGHVRQADSCLAPGSFHGGRLEGFLDQLANLDFTILYLYSSNFSIDFLNKGFGLSLFR